MSIYEYTIKSGKDEDVALSDFKGKVMMIVNTATGCGFTPQYEAIEKMYEKYHDQGFEVIDIPCNLPQMKKSEVNGENELPLYTYLKSQQGFKGFGMGPMALAMGAMLKKIDKDYKNNPAIKWNFTKFVVDRNGNVVARFEPTEDMKKVDKFVAGLL